MSEIQHIVYHKAKVNNEIHQKLVNADYLHENGFFVGNSQINLKKEITILYKITSHNLRNFKG